MWKCKKQVSRPLGRALRWSRGFLGKAAEGNILSGASLNDHSQHCCSARKHHQAGALTSNDATRQYKGVESPDWAFLGGFIGSLRELAIKSLMFCGTIKQLVEAHDGNRISVTQSIYGVLIALCRTCTIHARPLVSVSRLSPRLEGRPDPGAHLHPATRWQTWWVIA